MQKVEDSSAKPIVSSSSESAAKGEPAAERRKDVQGGNLVDRFVSVQDLYASKKIPLSGKNTVYTIDGLLKALPAGLPADLVRVTLQNVTQASYMELKELVADGEARISALEEYGEQFSRRTDEVTQRYEREIDQLKTKISEYQALIEQRKNLQTKQAETIQYEIDRISALISSVK